MACGETLVEARRLLDLCFQGNAPEANALASLLHIHRGDSGRAVVPAALDAKLRAVLSTAPEAGTAGFRAAESVVVVAILGLLPLLVRCDIVGDPPMAERVVRALPARFPVEAAALAREWLESRDDAAALMKSRAAALFAITVGLYACWEAGTGGGALCDHGFKRAKCKRCLRAGTGGSAICEHGAKRSRCKKCCEAGTGGSAICEHGAQRFHCMVLAW